MTDKTQYFHFTLGPVQSFVGQARRTRDFWAGSFILSWLSGVAMLAVKAQKGRILFPKADAAFLNAISGKDGQKPQQGSLPNRFKAEVNTDFSGEKVVQAVQDVWLALAKEIYDKDFVATGLDNEVSKAIWQRQVIAFWDMSWVISEDEADSSGLDRRKNWRSQFLPDEPGIKCSLMGDRQELSGIIGVRRKDRLMREAFWHNIAKQGRVSDFSDEREYLCAPAYIKRRFDKYFSHFSATVMDGGLEVSGWQVPASVPSVSYIAAAPWFAKVINEEGKSSELLKNFINAARMCNETPEYESTLRCVDEAAKAAGLSKADKGIDGNMFHELALDNPNICTNRQGAAQVKKALGRLTERYGAVSPFYAVLMMDGDNLGRQMSNFDKQEHITAVLNQFTQKVGDLVDKHSGFLIYAGGDDVLALLPLEYALPCAAAIRQHYQKCFFDKCPERSGIKTSISAAIIYTHINMPLKNVLRDAHDVLDRVAKDGAGRDALAVRVYKGSGIALQWAKKWQDALINEDKEDSGYHLDTILADFSKEDTAENEGYFSSKFFYRIRQRFALFGSGQSDTGIRDEDLCNVLCVDFIQSADNGKLTFAQAKDSISTLLAQCKSPLTQRTEVDGALLVRFLAQKGIERGGQ